MLLLLKRRYMFEKYTGGDLYLDGKFFCNTLEDMVRTEGPKVPGQTAIPAGGYMVEMTYSPKFKRMMPAVLNVPGFAGVRIHTGNTPADTDGCILVGTAVDFGKPDGRLRDSRIAFGMLSSRIEIAEGRGDKIYLTITEGG